MRDKCVDRCVSFSITNSNVCFLRTALRSCIPREKNSTLFCKLTSDRYPMSATSTAPNQQNAITRFLQLIRFSHTVFALPFALGALVVAANGYPSMRVLLLVILCMVFARTAAMLFNRLVDWSLDQHNPRTAARHLLVSKATAIFFLILCSFAFVLSALAINRATGMLALPALAIILFYSLTKRFTDATHFFLGLALAVAPVGAWLAQTGRFALPPLILSLGVICWVVASILSTRRRITILIAAKVCVHSSSNSESRAAFVSRNGCTWRCSWPWLHLDFSPN